MKGTKNRVLSLFALFCLSVVAAPASAGNQQGFSAWLEDFRSEAEQEGISRQTLNAALEDLRPLPKVLEFQRRQPETTLTWEEYRDRMISKDRILTARSKMRNNEDIIRKVSREYGVDSSILVALWAVESDFGRGTGHYSVLQSLATLAYQGRRQPFFRRELLAALTLVDKGWAKPSDLVGSWAGALGVFQFIPSTARHYAVDFDGDGRRDIFNNGPDAFASAANYLKEARWRSGQPWGTQVELAADFDKDLAGRRKPRKIKQWQELGVKGAEGLSCPSASLILAGEDEGQAFLVCDNFSALMRWNKSTWFALVIGLLSDRIAEAGGPDQAGAVSPVE